MSNPNYYDSEGPDLLTCNEIFGPMDYQKIIRAYATLINIVHKL